MKYIVEYVLANSDQLYYSDEFDSCFEAQDYETNLCDVVYSSIVVCEEHNKHIGSTFKSLFDELDLTKEVHIITKNKIVDLAAEQPDIQKTIVTALFNGYSCADIFDSNWSDLSELSYSLIFGNANKSQYSTIYCIYNDLNVVSNLIREVKKKLLAKL